jgi:hypothetical protein
MRTPNRAPLIALLSWLAGYLAVTGSANDAPAAPPAARQVSFPEAQRGFFKNYCVACHNAEKPEGQLRLDNLPLAIDSVQSADRWQKILNQLNSGDMPPEGAKQPDPAAKTEFLDTLANTLVEARKALSDQGGRIVMRRLNRREYKNTIRDLLGVDIETRELPADGGAGAFDTVGTSLFMSSDQFEQYLSLGRQAMDEHFARRAAEWREPAKEAGIDAKPPSASDAAQPPDTPSATPNIPTIARTIRERREVEDHANRMVGGTYNGYFKGGYEAAKKFLETGSPQKGIPDELEAKFRIKVFGEHGPTFERYLNDPLTKTGAYLTIHNVHTEEVITLPPDQPSGWLKTKHELDKAEPGEYMLRFRIGAVKGTPQERRFIALGSRQAGAEDFTLLRTFQITGETDAPQTIEAPISISVNGPRTFVLREKRDIKLDGELYQAARKETKVGPPSALWIDWVEWEGPLSAPTGNSAPSLMVTNENGESPAAHARIILERFATRAFRGQPPSPSYIDRLVKLFETRLAVGDRFDVAIREPLSVVLASPGFLYLSEPAAQPAAAAGTGQASRAKLSQRELAIRLSYFLWSAPPDEELLELARRGELANPEVLANQVDRLIDSPKFAEFVSGFLHQWLGMDRLDFFQFDTKLHRDFDESAKAAARREVYETFTHLVRDKERLGRLLKSDFVVVNGLLASYYGIEGVTGDDFRKVPLPADSPRGGLLGMAAILAMGSNGAESSPVERGAWVLRKLLHDPPPPAPPNVPQISRLESQLLTSKERLLAHQEQPQCASCHRKIDPIGFGLENFNASGKWRTTASYEKRGVGKKEWTIDPSGAFHKGPAFSDYFALRELISSREADFARGFTENLIEYALGRPYGFSDDELANEIVAAAGRDGFNIRRFLHALVASDPFARK